MKGKKYLQIFGASFSICIITFAALVNFLPFGACAETKRSSLIETLSKSQLNDGSFPSFSLNDTTYTVENTAWALISLDTLGALESISLTKASEFLNSSLYPIREMYLPYLLVQASKSFDNIELNRTALIEAVLARYDSGSGAFHELNNEASNFPVNMSNKREGYSNPNAITTFLCVEILHQLNAIEQIDKAKTRAWIESCRTDNGGYKPFPQSRKEAQNPFDVDYAGTNIPSTYCLISALKRLNHSWTDEEKGNTTNYILSCQSSKDSFVIHQNSTNDSLYYTYYAVSTLSSLEVLAKEGVEIPIRNAGAYVINQQNFDDRSETYGLFDLQNQYGSIIGSYFAIMTLKAVDRLMILNNATPRAITARFYLLLESLLFTGIGCAVTTLIIFNYDRQHFKKMNKMQGLEG